MKLTQKLILSAAVTTMLACNSGSTTAPTNFQPALDNRDDDSRPNIIVILTDDQGYADVGTHGVTSDIVTPNIDQLAADGVTMSAGYVTSPQCVPSRAALLTGKYQQRFGVDESKHAPLPMSEQTIGDHMQTAGYRTGMVGKWHLEVLKASENFDVETMPLSEQRLYFPDNRGFDDVHSGYINRWWSNVDANAAPESARHKTITDYRLHTTTNTANAFINQHKDTPFFLYVSYFAPHVPLEAPQEYLDKFSHISQERRRYGLAMMAAMDDGIGSIRDTLNEHSIDDNTLIFFLSDNGAPLGGQNRDRPLSDIGANWDGSLNTPLNGEKGMLTEGGIRVPFIATWPGVLPAGSSYDQPVSSLDITATSLAVSKQPALSDLDGENLIPQLTGDAATLSDRTLFWRFQSQSAVRQGNWKYLKADQQREYLFDISTDISESQNLIHQNPDIASDLKDQLQNWIAELPTEPAPPDTLPPVVERWYDFYLN